MARRIIVEVEVPEGRSIEEILQGVKYRVISIIDEDPGGVEDDRVGAMDWEGPAWYRECGGTGEA